MLKQHLRVCGEESAPVVLKRCRLEIPPRVRRRGAFGFCLCLTWGNTSACAEKRKNCPTRKTYPWKYLRVCGEEWPFR